MRLRRAGISGAPHLCLSFLLLFIIGFAIGVGNIPWVYLAEILPAEIKGTTAAVATALNWIGSIGIAWLFPLSVETFGTGQTYLAIALVNGAAAVFVSAYMVETRLRSREAVLDILLLKT